MGGCDGCFPLIVRFLIYIWVMGIPLKRGCQKNTEQWSSIIEMGCEQSFLASHDLNRRAEHLRARIQTEFLAKRTQKTIEGQPSAPTLTEGLFSITDQDIDMIEGLLQGHHLFYKVKSFTGKEIMSKLQKFTAKQGETIFRKGDPADYFYIILEGIVEIRDLAQGVEGRSLERGHCFGDLGIENKANRSGTALARTAVRLLGLRRNHYMRVSLQLIRKAQNQIFKEIKNISVFSFLNMHQKHKISFFAQEFRYNKGTYIFRRGQNSDCLYVIRSGRVRLQAPNKESIEVVSRQSFGESSLKAQRTIRFADALCLQNCVLLVFSKHDMIKYLGNSLSEIEITNKVIWSLKREPNLNISPIIIDAMINSKEVRHFNDGEAVAKKGDHIDHFIISLQGGINQHGQLDLLNCSYLKGLKYQTEDLVKKGDGTVVLISIDEIEDKFNRKFDLLLNLDHMISKEIESYLVLQEYAKSLQLDNFQIVQEKGMGLYGPTLRVKSDSNIEFALKVFDKSKVIEDCAHESVYMLRRINIKVVHNLVARAYRIYSDQRHLFFLNKLVGGQTLSECLVRHGGKLPLHLIRHFSACMVNILQYLHCKRILWREMKIESFVVDGDGYLNLVDLMYLQELKEDEFYIETPSKATLYYLSPETLSGQGYGLQSDFWALGVVIYRMAVGEYPFGQQINQQDPSILDLLSDQVNAFRLKFPQWVPTEVKTVIKLLLNPNSLERSLISINRLKSMSLFTDFDWLGLMERNMKHTPYIPKKPTVKMNHQEIGIQTWIQAQTCKPPENDCLDGIHDI